MTVDQLRELLELVPPSARVDLVYTPEGYQLVAAGVRLYGWSRVLGPSAAGADPLR